MAKAHKKAQKRLQIRINNWERIKKSDSNNGKGFTKPGSQKK